MKGTPRLIEHPLVALAVFGLAVLVSRLLLRETDLTAALRLLGALLPVSGAVFLVVTQLHGVRRMDELYQRIQLEALVSALVVTFLTLVFVRSFRRAHLLTWDFDDAWSYAFLAGYVLGYAIAAKRYRYQ